MKAKIAKWGNSYALRIPKQVVDQLELSEEGELLLTLKDNGFVVSKPSKEERLAELLKTMVRQKETDWGPPRGKEVW